MEIAPAHKDGADDESETALKQCQQLKRLTGMTPMDYRENK